MSMIGVRQITLMIFAAAGLWGTWQVSEIYRDDAKKSWEVAANQSSQWLSGTLLGWLEESYAPLSGIAALYENSDEVTESEFLNAFESLESRATAFFLDGMAFYRPIGSGDSTRWQIKYASDDPENFSGPQGNVASETMPQTLSVARIRSGEFILGEPRRDPSTNSLVSPIALAIYDRSGDGIVAGLVNYNALIKGLFDLHVPEGLSLKISGRFPVKNGLGPEGLVWSEEADNILLSVTTRTLSAGADLSITWQFDKRFLGGPSERLADFTLFSGIGGVLAFTLIFGLLLQRNQEISRRVATATEDLQREQHISTMAMENMEQGINMFDANLVLTSSNEKAFQMLEFPDDFRQENRQENMTLEAMFRNAAERGTYGEGDIDELVAQRVAIARERQAGTFELVTPSGRTIEVRCIPIESGGQVRTYTDITKRKKSEEALARETATLNMTLENIDQGITMVDSDLNLVLANKTVWEMQDLPQNVLVVGKSIERGFRYLAERGDYGPGNVEELVRQRMETFARFEPHHFERTRTDGSVIEVVGQPLPGGGMVTTYRDVTARTQAQAQISKLSGAVEQNASSIVITDPDGKIEYVNPAFTRVSGFSPEDVMGLAFRLLEPGILEPDVLDGLWQTIKAGDVWQGEFNNTKKNGEKYWEHISLSPLVDADGKTTNFVGIKEDITQRKEAEDELRKARYEAEAASQAKAEFLASMSHEIRTPMNGVVGMADLLSQTDLDEEQRIMLNTVRDSGNALLTIINDILDFSKIEAGKLDIEHVPFSVVDVVEGAAATMSPTASQKGVRIVTSIDPNVPTAILGDPVRLRQIVFNLTGNAVKFSEEGEVVVRAETKEASDGSARLLISVIDHGIGISEEGQAKLFGAFSQAESSTTRRFGGTGLGLAICKNLTEMMGGEVRVQSKIGSGSTFSVEMPMAISEESRSRDEDVNLAGLHVLVVTQKGPLQETIDQYLSHWLAEVDFVEEEDAAESFINLRAAEGKPVDVVVLDFNLDTERQKAAVARLATDNITFVMLSNGQRRSARIEGPDCVTLDGNPLRQSQLVTAVAVAAGRASPLVRPEVDENTTENVVALSVEEARERGTLILLAEDNMTNQQVIGRQLTKLGYTCEMADDGKLALEAWRGGDYALLLTDCHMPHMDGFELTASVRAYEEGSGKRSPIIAVTANALEGEAERCISAGMDDYLSKPLAMADLKTTLRKWMPEFQAEVAEETAVDEAVETKVVEASGTITEQGGQRAVEPTFLRETFGDDDELVREILMDFVEPARDTVSEIDTAFSARDAAAIGAAAHKLKSSSRSVGAETLADLCANLEKAGKSEAWSEIDELHPRLAASIDAVTKEIEAF
jgi:PAS domain S-box-containing protein